MAESTSRPAALTVVQAQLRTIARLLREVQPMGPELRQLMAGVLEELSEALDSPTVPPDRLAHLMESTAHLVEAVHAQQDTHKLSGLRERLEKAVTAVEGEYPTLAGLGRQLLDALSNIGI